MPIVDGKYEAKIATVFASVGDATEQIMQKIAKSRKVRLSNIPMSLLEELTASLAGKDIKIILPENRQPNDKLHSLGELAVSKARIYKDYKGTEAHVVSVSFADRIFSITWADDEILEIEAMEYDKCVKCMKQTFEVAWHYAKKL